MNKRTEVSILHDKKTNSLNPFVSFFDISIYATITTMFMYVAILVCQNAHIKDEGLHAIIIGSLVGQAVTMIRQVQMIATAFKSDEKKIVDRLKNIGYKKLKDDTSTTYIKDVPRWSRWDSDLVHINVLDDKHIVIQGPAKIVKKL